MDGDAFLFMFLSWGMILGLNIFCFTLLFTRSEPQKPVQIGTDKTKKIEEDEEIT